MTISTGAQVLLFVASQGFGCRDVHKGYVARVDAVRDDGRVDVSFIDHAEGYGTLSNVEVRPADSLAEGEHDEHGSGVDFVREIQQQQDENEQPQSGEVDNTRQGGTVGGLVGANVIGATNTGGTAGATDQGGSAIAAGGAPGNTIDNGSQQGLSAGQSATDAPAPGTSSTDAGSSADQQS